jgi:hypothetical protein
LKQYLQTTTYIFGHFQEGNNTTHKVAIIMVVVQQYKTK